MKIVVTGGTGFIGKYLIAGLHDKYEILVLTRQNIKEIHRIANENYIKTDYSKEHLRTCFKECGALVHMSAIRMTESKEKSIENYFDNIRIAENLFTAANDVGIKNVIVISSRSVYNANMHMPVKEDMAAPMSLYGISKLAVENLAGIFNQRYKMNIKSLRLAQVIGVGERENLMSTYLNNCIQNIPLKVYGEGKSSKAYIYVKDVVSAIDCALNKPDVCGAFNISMKESISNKELAKAYCDVFGNTFELLPDEKEDGEIWYLDTAKANEVLRFEPKYDLIKSLLDTRKIIKNNT